MEVGTQRLALYQGMDSSMPHDIATQRLQPLGFLRAQGLKPSFLRSFGTAEAVP
jgi:hypothetical protein